MKKISLVLLLLFVFNINVISVSANSIRIDSVNINESQVTINYNTESMSDGDQITVITYKADNSSVAPTESNIKYIDQITKSSNTSLDFSFNETPSGTYQIKMGGTDIETPDVISVTVTDKMSGNLNFMNNKINLFSDKISIPEHIVDNRDRIFILRPENNYIAAYSQIPYLDGYSVKSYGIVLNGNEYSANVSATNYSNFGVLFHGTGITNEFPVTAFPYVVYEKNGETITFYGTTLVDTLYFNE